MNIILQDSAKRNLRKLPNTVVDVVLKKLSSIQNDPLHFIERLKGMQLWKLRIGEYRALLFLDTGNQAIHVVKIGHRKDVYR